MKTRNKAKIISPPNATISPRSDLHLAASEPTLIDADAITVVLGSETVLDDISLCIHAGEFVGIIGPNGAGKTTLLRTLLGFITPQRGTIRTARKNSIGYIPQRSMAHQSQIPISVLEIVLLGARGKHDKALKALAAVDMVDVASKRFDELSGGQQQRVFIAKALASDPALLILDEPTTGIDEQSQVAFYAILRSLQKQGIAIVMISHDVDTVLGLVTRVVCLNRTLLYDGPPEHFETDKYLPQFYKTQHRVLHHHHGEPHV